MSCHLTKAHDHVIWSLWGLVCTHTTNQICFRNLSTKQGWHNVLWLWAGTTPAQVQFQAEAFCYGFLCYCNLSMLLHGLAKEAGQVTCRHFRMSPESRSSPGVPFTWKLRLIFKSKAIKLRGVNIAGDTRSPRIGTSI